jgi:hypothetical protein
MAAIAAISKTGLLMNFQNIFFIQDSFYNLEPSALAWGFRPKAP